MNKQNELEGHEKGPAGKMHLYSLRATLKKVPISKTPGHDGIHEYMFFKKSLLSMSDRLSKWIDTYKKQIYPNGNTKENPKKTPKSNRHQNIYRPITCQQMMWNILTEQVKENLKESLIRCGLLSRKRKEVTSGPELLYIDQHILKERKTKRKSLSMMWCDYKKAYDIVPESWIIYTK